MSTNNLPTFKTKNIDDTIVNKESELLSTGFLANTPIKAAEVNTYLQMLVNLANGLVDALGDTDIGYTINATTTTNQFTEYFINAIGTRIQKSNAGTADEANVAKVAYVANNVSDITNISGSNSALVKFSIGDKEYSKTINNVEHASTATTATNVSSIVKKDVGSNQVSFSIGDKEYSKIISGVELADRAVYLLATDYTTKLSTGNEKTPVYFKDGITKECKILKRYIGKVKSIDNITISFPILLRDTTVTSFSSLHKYISYFYAGVYDDVYSIFGITHLSSGGWRIYYFNTNNAGSSSNISPSTLDFEKNAEVTFEEDTL